jgi:hypothetical protein
MFESIGGVAGYDPMHNVRKLRLVLTLFLLFVTGWLGVTGVWEQILDLPNTLRRETSAAQYDAYARSLGKTTEQLANEYYQEQVEGVRKAREAGRVECSIIDHFSTSHTGCYLPPHRGLPALGGEPSYDDMREGRRRTLEKSGPLLLPFIGSLVAALFLVYVLPAMVRGFWAWLAPTPDHEPPT